MSHESFRHIKAVLLVLAICACSQHAPEQGTAGHDQTASRAGRRLEELAANVTIYRDEYGIPHDVPG